MEEDFAQAAAVIANGRPKNARTSSRKVDIHKGDPIMETYSVREEEEEGHVVGIYGTP